MLIVTLAVQVVAIFVFSDFVVFKIMVRDYDSAVMAVDFIQCYLSHSIRLGCTMRTDDTD
ncbi:MAG: hypothetical protein E7245_16495 [Enterocloster clostridioformis]|uniref:sodium/glutamate symporter n=1 Tax=Enterocloster clostridioformis TaxID=1531 RepID=UPI003AB938A0|nr:hypothetical protein [Enterocloster clostridioformis]